MPSAPLAAFPGEQAIALPAPAAFPVAIPEDRERAVQCLSTAIAYEAGYEPIEGQQAVAEVILNRLRNPLFPKTVCGVVFAGSDRKTGCQFSFTCDGSLRRHLPDRVMAQTRLVAEAALDGRNPLRVAGANWYHADYVSPYWAPSLVRVTRIGAHIFYRAPGFGDRPMLANAVTPAGEPLIAALTGQAAAAAATSIATSKMAASVPRIFAPWGLGRAALATSAGAQP